MDLGKVDSQSDLFSSKHEIWLSFTTTATEISDFSKRVVGAILEDTECMLVVSEGFDIFVLHKLCRSDIDQDLGCVSHGQIVVLAADLD